jgi:hypothetical protein
MKRRSSLPMQISNRYSQLGLSAGIGEKSTFLRNSKHPLGMGMLSLLIGIYLRPNPPKLICLTSPIALGSIILIDSPNIAGPFREEGQKVTGLMRRWPI